MARASDSGRVVVTAVMRGTVDKLQLATSTLASMPRAERAPIQKAAGFAVLRPTAVLALLIRTAAPQIHHARMSCSPLRGWSSPLQEIPMPTPAATIARQLPACRTRRIRDPARSPCERGHTLAEPAQTAARATTGPRHADNAEVNGACGSNRNSPAVPPSPTSTTACSGCASSTAPSPLACSRFS